MHVLDDKAITKAKVILHQQPSPILANLVRLLIVFASKVILLTRCAQLIRYLLWFISKYSLRYLSIPIVLWKITLNQFRFKG
jgi:beta-lactamase regulating signal transducer with metallopeptidase domain